MGVGSEKHIPDTHISLFNYCHKYFPYSNISQKVFLHSPMLGWAITDEKKKDSSKVKIKEINSKPKTFKL